MPYPDTKAKVLEKASNAPFSPINDEVASLSHGLSISTAKRAQHVQPPVQELPTELLEVVFALVLPEVEEVQFKGPNLYIPTYYISLQDLMKVCQRWRAVIKQATALWCFVSLCSRLDFNDLAFSSEAPLLIDCREPQGQHTQAERESFFSGLRQNRHRWLHISFHVPNKRLGWEFIHLVAREVHLPALRSLDVRFSNPGYPLWNFELLQECFVRLKHLRLEGEIYVNWTQFSVHSLESFVLERMLYSPPPMKVLDILRNSPGLRRFEISCQWSDDLSHEVDEAEAVSLPILRTLALQSPFREGVTTILRHIDPLPTCSRFDVVIRKTAKSSRAALDASLGHHMQTVLKIIKSCIDSKGPVTLELRQDAFCFAAATPGPDDALGCRMTLYPTEKDEILCWFQEALCRGNLPIKLTLDIAYPWKDPRNLQSLLKLDPVRLTVEEGASRYEADFRDLLRILSDPVIQDGKQEGWPFPHLQHLDIKCTELDPEALIKLLEGRYGISDQVHHVIKPSRLLTLDLSHSNLQPAVRAKVRQIVGQDTQIVFCEARLPDLDVTPTLAALALDSDEGSP